MQSGLFYMTTNATNVWNKMKAPLLLIVMPTLSLVWLALGVVVWASIYPGYSHLSQFMSELGATGSPIGPWVNYSVFILAEIWVFMFLWAAYTALPRTKLVLSGLVFMCAYACFLVIASLFPCDFECSITSSSQSQLIHLTFGLLAYLCGLMGLLFLSHSAPQWSTKKQNSQSAFLLVLRGVCLFAGTLVFTEYDGLIQRALEALIYGWMIHLGIAMYLRGRLVL
jgi:hypothetical membrane protein